MFFWKALVSHVFLVTVSPPCAFDSPLEASRASLDQQAEGRNFKALRCVAERVKRPEMTWWVHTSR